MRMVLLVLLLALAACGGMSARETATEECSSKGYDPGSADYLNCREQVMRDIEFREGLKRAVNPVPTTSPPPTFPPFFRF